MLRSTTGGVVLQNGITVTGGSITMDGRDLRTLNLKQLHSHFALVQQEPILFAGTILFNIQCGKESATRQRPSRP